MCVVLERFLDVFVSVILLDFQKTCKADIIPFNRRGNGSYLGIQGDSLLKWKEHSNSGVRGSGFNSASEAEFIYVTLNQSLDFPQNYPYLLNEGINQMVFGFPSISRSRMP